MAGLVTLRRAKGLSQKELADLAEVSPATIYEIEVGKRPTPQGRTLRKLASALGVDVAELAEDFYLDPKGGSLLTAERALRMSNEAFTAELKTTEASRLLRLLSQLVGDDITKTRADLKAGGGDAISQRSFALALEVRAEILRRGGAAPEESLPAFRRRLEALHLR